MWDLQAQALANSYRVIRCDLRGFGRSTTEHVEFAYWADVAALLDHIGVDRAHVVGQSIGGSIALDLALARPACVATLTSIAGGISGYRPDLGPEEDNVPWSDMDRLWDEMKWVELDALRAPDVLHAGCVSDAGGRTRKRSRSRRASDAPSRARDAGLGRRLGPTDDAGEPDTPR